MEKNEMFEQDLLKHDLVESDYRLVPRKLNTVCQQKLFIFARPQLSKAMRKSFFI